MYNFNNADIRPNYEDIDNIDDLCNDSITRHFSDVDEHVINAIIKKNSSFLEKRVSNKQIYHFINSLYYIIALTSSIW